MRKHCIACGPASVFLLAIGSATAMDMPAQLKDCAAIPSAQERLLCYDRLAADAGNRAAAIPDPGETKTLVLPEQPPALPIAPGDDGRTSALAEHWELYPSNKRGIFNFRPHHPNYLITTYNAEPNNTPYLPFRALAPNADGLSHNELTFQLGFKLKLVENAFNQPVDVWFGYTQRSFWQAGNQKASSPFRESDYQPELMAVFPTHLDLMGLKMRFINLGVVHQSNGQASTLSRSWNRLYAQAGFEYGNVSLLARVWKRFNEPAGEDDNPDIVNYMGRGDLAATYHWNGHDFSLLTRYNFHTNKGAAQLDWAFPLVANLKGYVQYFTGYGYSMIDYNAFQRVFGLGVLVSF